MLKNLFLGFIFLLLVLPATSNAQSAAIMNGLNWLKSSQDVTGSWNSGQSSSTAYYTTAAVLETFAALGDTSSPLTTGLSWLSAEKAESTTYLALKVKIVAASGGDTTTDINTLLSYQNSGSGWGVYLNYTPRALDTSLALQALKAVNYADQTIINPALANLTASKNPDGGWGFSVGDASNVYLTAIVSATLAQYKSTYDLRVAIASASSYLLASQNPDGSFGTNSSNVYETALAFIALIESGQGQTQSLLNAITYLTSTQSANGSWNDDPYSSALALRALSYVKPDLSVLPANIAVLPATPTVGSNIAVTAAIANIGLDAATNVTVRLLDNGAAIGDQTVASIAPSWAGQTTFAISPLTPVGEHILTISVDPANTIDELSEANNSATTRIWAKALADLVVLPEYLSISPAYPKPTDSITLTFQIANMGETAVNNVAADLYDGNPSSGGVKLGSATVSSINPGGLGSGTIAFTLAAAGSHTLYLIADPQHAITELSTANNSAQKTITVNATSGSGFIDLAIPMNGIRLDPARPAGGATVTVDLAAVNFGTEAAIADLELFDGDPAGGGAPPLQGRRHPQCRRDQECRRPVADPPWHPRPVCLHRPGERHSRAG